MSVERSSQMPLHAAGLSRETVDANFLGRIGATPELYWLGDTDRAFETTHSHTALQLPSDFGRKAEFPDRETEIGDLAKSFAFLVREVELRSTQRRARRRRRYHALTSAKNGASSIENAVDAPLSSQVSVSVTMKG